MLQAACESNALDEVIVIDDGSTDHTRTEILAVSHPKLRPIFLEENGGKARAVMAGIEAARGEYIVMIDSDLIGLEGAHIDALIRPILEGRAQATLSIRENSLWIYKLLGTDFVSGERVMPKRLFADEEYFREGAGFGLEVKINERILSEGYTLENVPLRGVITPRKSKKMGIWKGFLADMNMINEICKTLPLSQILRQCWYFSRFASKKSRN